MSAEGPVLGTFLQICLHFNQFSVLKASLLTSCLNWFLMSCTSSNTMRFLSMCSGFMGYFANRQDRVLCALNPGCCPHTADPGEEGRYLAGLEVQSLRTVEGGSRGAGGSRSAAGSSEESRTS